MKMRLLSSLAASAAALLLAACGGGGGGSSHVPASTPVTSATTVPSGPMAQVTLRISTATIPASTQRAPKFVSPSTASATIALQGQPTPLATVNFMPGSANCNGQQCTVTFSAPVGSDTFVVTTYDQPNGAGNALSTASVVATVVLNATNTVALTLNGVIAQVRVILGSSSVQAGTPAAIPVTVVASDAAGNVIIGPGNYSTPVTLTNSDTSNVTQLSPNLVPGPGTAVTLNYNGGSSIGATITPSAGSATAYRWGT